MLSFQRFVSVLNSHRPTFPYKDIYTYRGTYCVFRTNYQPHLDWVLLSFQYYYHHCRDEDNILKFLNEDCFYVYSIVDEGMFNRLFEWIEEIVILRVGYFKDEIAEIKFVDGGMVVDRKKKMLLCFNQTLQHLYVVSDGSQQEVQGSITQTIREIMTWKMEARGFYLLHASAVVKHDRAVLFCGESGVGKTTIMLGLLQNGYHFLANDRVYIGVEDRKVKVISWPSSIGVRLATTMQYEPLIEIYADLGSLDFPQKRIHSLALDQLERNEIDRIDLSTREIVSLFQTKFVREAEVEQVFLIDHFSSDEQFKEMEFSPTLIESVRKQFFFPHDDPNDPAFASWFQPFKQYPAKVFDTYELTQKILCRLIPIRKLGRERYPTIDEKIERLIRQI